MNNLVIVESPTKARTLQKFLGKDYEIEASMGHIRDLPKSELGVDLEHSFNPQYVIPRDKRKRVNDLKKKAKDAKNLWLASDPDREGEAIAWHIAELLGESKGQVVKRVVFHEITPEAIKEAFAHPREIDMKLVDAQQARRVLDRLVGYKLSPLLWSKIKRGLSAGRVQSVALRLIVERQREIDKFKPIEYWSIEAELEGESIFRANLVELNKKKLEMHSQAEVDSHLEQLKKADYSINKLTKKEVRRFPYPPFTTSTLQQTAANRLGMSAKKIMMLAQTLYEHGLITYMRTDSVNLATSAVDQAREYIDRNFGKTYLPSAAKVYKSKSKNAQEAHEAIRPTDANRQSADIGRLDGLTRDHTRLYDLIWKRFIACQMVEALMDQTTIDVGAKADSNLYIFRATGSIIKFEGWLKLLGKEIEEETSDVGTQPSDQQPVKQQVLPKVSEGEILQLKELLPEQHFTEPPPKYNEASLIKKLEELGIGRPSTYAPILSTIQERFYVEREARRFTPTPLGIAVNDFIVQHFAEIVDYTFTAQMEDELDEISRGEREWRPTIKSFYGPFEKKLALTADTAEKVKLEMEMTDKICSDCGKNLVVRIGKFGKFLACSGFPECKHTETLEEQIDAKCPKDGGDLIVRRTRSGKTFYGCRNWPTCTFASWSKPKDTHTKAA
jgi:DNA topoisomerase-1